MRRLNTIGLTVWALLALAAGGAAQVPPSGSGARMPPPGTAQPPTSGPPTPSTPGSAGTSSPGKAKKEDPREVAKREKEAIETAMHLAPMRWFYVVHFPAGPAVEPAYDQERFFAAMKDGQLGAWSVLSGTPAWLVPATVAVQPIVTDSGRVYIAGKDEVEAVDAATGQRVWQKPIGDATPSAPPVARGGWLIVAFDSGLVRAMRGESGETVWELKLPSPVKTPPVIIGDRLYVAPQDKRLLGLDLMSGQQLWVQEFDGLVSSLDATTARVLVGTRENFIALNHAGRPEWKWRVGAEVIGQPAFDDSTVYVALTDNTVRAFALDGGSMRWRTPLDYRPMAGPAAHGGSLLLVGITPVLHAYNLKDGKSVADLPIPVDARLNVAEAPPHVTPGRPFFYDTATVMLAQGYIAGARRVGPGPYSLFTDPGTVLPALTFPAEPPPPATASVPTAPPKP